MTINIISDLSINIVNIRTKDAPGYKWYLKKNKIYLFIIFSKIPCNSIYGRPKIIK